MLGGRDAPGDAPGALQEGRARAQEGRRWPEALVRTVRALGVC